MKCNIINLFLTLLVLLSAVQSFAQGKARVDVSHLSVVKENGQMFINMIVKSECLEIHTAQSLWLDITLEDEKQVLQLPALIYTGNQRYRFDERNNRLPADDVAAPYQVFKGIDEKTVYLSDYACRIPYAEWMDYASLRLKCIFHDCCDEHLVGETLLLAIADTRPDMFEHVGAIGAPENTVVYRESRKEIVPGKFAVAVHYELKSDLLSASYAGNRNALVRIDSLLRVIASNEEITLRKIKMTGYASPEGTYSFNKELARKRFEGFKRYLINEYRLSGELFSGSWIAEDWDGVLNALDGVEIDHKDLLTDIIHKVGIFKGREAQLMNLAGGRPYLQLLDRVFPLLRRVELDIDYDTTEYK